MDRTNYAIALIRFGLGARPGDLARPELCDREALRRQSADPDAFLLNGERLPTSAQAGAILTEYVAGRQAMRGGRSSIPTTTMASPEAQMEAVAGPVRKMIQFSLPDVMARTRHAITTDSGYAERLVQFWSNHFTVSASKAMTIPYAGVFEREAIRANLTGSFADLLLASVRHPGMLLYLDQFQSIGPNSAVGRRRSAGLNENLAREILELHTLGVDGGYSQADVTEFARALTGSTIANARIEQFVPGARIGKFAFIEEMHEPGVRTIMGRQYPQTGEAQSLAILRNLATHRATARHIATKLARHFVADAPPTALVEALEQNFLRTGGNLPELHRTLIEHPLAWQSEPAKFKTPNEFLISSLRATSGSLPDPRSLADTFRALGQLPFRASSPAGWPDDAASWAGSDSVMKRLEWAQAYADSRNFSQRPEQIAEEALGPLLLPRTREAIRRAETPQEGVVLALMSPEFQRR